MNPLPLLRAIKAPAGTPEGLDDAARRKLHGEWMRITEELMPYLPDGSTGPYDAFVGAGIEASKPFGKATALERLQWVLKFLSIQAPGGGNAKGRTQDQTSTLKQAERQELYREWVRVTEELSRFFPSASLEALPAFLAEIRARAGEASQPVTKSVVPTNKGPVPNKKAQVSGAAEFAERGTLSFERVNGTPPPSVPRQPAGASATPFADERKRIEYWLEFMAAAGFVMPNTDQISVLQAALRQGNMDNPSPDTIRQYLETYVTLIGAKNAGRGPLEYSGKGMGPADARMLRVVENMARARWPELINTGAAVEIAASTAATLAGKIDLLQGMKGVTVDPAMVLLLLAARFQRI